MLSLEGLRPFAVGGHWLPEMKHLAGGADELQEHVFLPMRSLLPTPLGNALVGFRTVPLFARDPMVGEDVLALIGELHVRVAAAEKQNQGQAQTNITAGGAT